MEVNSPLTEMDGKYLKLIVDLSRLVFVNIQTIWFLWGKIKSYLK